MGPVKEIYFRRCWKNRYPGNLKKQHGTELTWKGFFIRERGMGTEGRGERRQETGAEKEEKEREMVTEKERLRNRQINREREKNREVGHRQGPFKKGT